MKNQFARNFPFTFLLAFFAKHMLAEEQSCLYYWKENSCVAALE